MLDPVSNGPCIIKRLHIAANQDICDDDKLFKTLSEYNVKQIVIAEGSIIYPINSPKECSYTILKCEPNHGLLDSETLVFIDRCVDPLHRIQLLWSINDEVFSKIMGKLINSNNINYKKSEYVKDIISENRLSAIGPFYLSSSSKLKPKLNVSLNLNCENPIGNDKEINTLNSLINLIYRAKLESFFLRNPKKIYYPGQVFYSTDLEFIVYAIYPPAKPDPFGEYESVTISAIKDTLPKSYDFDLYEEYLYPALKNRFKEGFRLGDSFNYLGIDFKITSTEPSVSPYGCMRIGLNTKIVVGSKRTPHIAPVDPKLVDLIPPDLSRQIRLLSPRQQHIALRMAALQLDDLSIQRIISCYSEQFKTSDELIKSLSERVKVYKSIEADCDAKTEYTHCTSSESDFYRNICTVCCQSFKDSDKCIAFDCGHLFHWTCVRFWIGENQTCPNCRAYLGDPKE